MLFISAISIGLFKKYSIKWKCKYFIKRLNLRDESLHIVMLLVMFSFTVLNRKYLFWAKLFIKIKIACLMWNMVPRLIQICWYLWWCSFALHCAGNTVFGQFFYPKIKIACLRWNLVFRLIQVCWIRCSCSHTLFSNTSTLFGQIWAEKSKLPV